MTTNYAPRNDGMFDEVRRANMVRGVGPIVALAGLTCAAIYGAGLLTDNAYGESAATEYLEQAGYSKVVHESTDFRTPLTLFALPGCSPGDMVKYTFDATAPNGTHHVSRVVCKGLVNGPTIH